MDSSYSVEQQQIVFPSETLCESCESSLKSQDIKKTIEPETSTLVVDLPTESRTHMEDMLEEDVVNYKVSMKQDMVEELSKAVRKMEQEIC